MYQGFVDVKWGLDNGWILQRGGLKTERVCSLGIFAVTLELIMQLPNSRSNQNKNQIKPKIWRGSIIG